MNKFHSCYTKCAKMLLGFTKYYSVTNMLLLTGLLSFDTLVNNARKSDAARWSASSNALVVASSCVNVHVGLHLFSVLVVLLCVLCFLYFYRSLCIFSVFFFLLHV